MPEPLIAVVVPARDRPLRLRWLLNALEDQTLGLDQFEVLVAHDSFSDEVDRVLETHPLAHRGVLRQLRSAPGSLRPGANRNVGWRGARAPLVMFTDDDCRPAPNWLEQALAAWREHPGVVIQGRTLPDPEETATLRGAPWAHTVRVEPPTRWAESCNIGYPRELLERLDGFDEHTKIGEDTDLAMRAQELGVPFVPAPQLLVYHAVEDRSLRRMIRAQDRWSDMVWLVKRHPSARRDMFGHIWWVREHAALAAALVGLGLARRHPAALALGGWWVGLSLEHRGLRPRGIIRSITEMPGRAAIDGAGLIALARASLHYRTLLL